jgi:septal ring factor EnvC (AmiA/AmiB activator)
MSKKIEEKDFKKLKLQESTKSKVLYDIGTVEAQKHELLHALAELVNDSKKLNKELEEKYGKITVNLEDGTYQDIEEGQDGEVD